MIKIVTNIDEIDRKLKRFSDESAWFLLDRYNKNGFTILW